MPESTQRQTAPAVNAPAEVITLLPRPWVDSYGYTHHRLWLELAQPMRLGRCITFQILREWKIGWLKLSRDARLVGVVTVHTLGGVTVEQHALSPDLHIDLSRWLELMVILRAQQCTPDGVPTRAFVEFVSTHPRGLRA